MQKTFNVGDKVLVTADEAHELKGFVGEVREVVQTDDEDNLSGGGYVYAVFPGSTSVKDMRFSEIELVGDNVTNKMLVQVIVNTHGLARTLAQVRDEKGRFTGKASVGELLNPADVLHLAAHSDNAVVVVHHSYVASQQTVTSVNRDTKKGNAVTFLNNGVSASLHDSIYGGE